MAWVRAENEDIRPTQLTDSGVMFFKGRSYTAEQMRGRSEAMMEAAKFLRSESHRLSEAQALAADLASEAQEWAKRAKRCCDALTPGQRRTYEQLLAYLAHHGRSPTMVELAALEQVTSSTIQTRIRALMNKGFVCKLANVPGGLSIADAPRGSDPGQRPL
jgi:predicted transcriptional regulator